MSNGVPSGEILRRFLKDYWWLVENYLTGDGDAVRRDAALLTLIDRVRKGERSPVILPAFAEIWKEWSIWTDVERKSDVEVAKESIRKGGRLLAGGKILEYEGEYLNPTSLIPFDVATAQKMIDDFEKVDTGEMTPTQRARYDLDVSELKESTRRWELSHAEDLRRYELERGISGREQEATQAYRQQQLALQRREQELKYGQEDPRIKELEFENWRQEMVARLSGSPRDWIGLYTMRNMPNPFMVQPSGVSQQQTQAEIGLGKIQEAQGQLQRERPWEAPEGTPMQMGGAEERLYNLVKEYGGVIKEQQKAAREAAATGEWPGQGQPKPKESLPPTPGWLPALAPGLTAGKPITKVPIETPSGQTWGRMTPSMQEMTKGFADWRGGTWRPWEDIGAEMQRMLPGTPTRPRGWRPTRQR